MLTMLTDGARKGNDAYEKGDFAGAEQAYLEALRQNPDDARIYFNLGNALAKQGKFDEAISAYERFKDMSPDPQSKAMADFNIGNIYGNQEKWDRAKEQFRNALRQNPYDEDAKYNYELSNRIQQEQEENPQQNQRQNSDQEQDGEDGQQQQDSQPDDSQNDQQNRQQESRNQNGDEQQESSQQQSQPQEIEMSKEEADRILNALENKEKDLLKEFHKNKVPSTTRHAKNW
jgi:Ca-activated chloride channel family protein